MAIELVCVQPIHGFKIGAEVKDPEMMAKLLASHPHAFVKRAVPDEPPPVEPSEPPVPIDPPS